MKRFLFVLLFLGSSVWAADPATPEPIVPATAEEAKYIEDWNVSYAAAVAKWPEISDPQSALHLLAGALQDEALNDKNHPEHFRTQHGSSAFYFARKAANMIGATGGSDVAALRAELAKVTAERDAALARAASMEALAQRNYDAAMRYANERNAAVTVAQQAASTPAPQPQVIIREVPVQVPVQVPVVLPTSREAKKAEELRLLRDQERRTAEQQMLWELEDINRQLRR